ncbi:MAG: type II secretion system protein [Candidatus Sumerlaeaceae bacterium]
MNRGGCLPGVVRRVRAFTLIELLMVVAIIAILAAIAIPNFLEAQTRAKVSRAKADMRTIMTALEAYRVDATAYPEDYAATTPRADGLGRLTSPVAYISSVPLDAFGGYFDSGLGVQVKSYSLGSAPEDHPTRWALASAGPDRTDDTVPLFDYPGYSESIWENPLSGYAYYRYDPTNGTVSKGDVIRVSDHGEMP